MDYHTEDRWKRYQQSVGTNRCHTKMVQQDGTTRCYTTRWDNIKYQRTHNVVKYTVSDCASNITGSAAGTTARAEDSVAPAAGDVEGT